MQNVYTYRHSYGSWQYPWELLQDSEQMAEEEEEKSRVSQTKDVSFVALENLVLFVFVRNGWLTTAETPDVHVPELLLFMTITDI